MIHLNIGLLLSPHSSKWPLSFWFSNQKVFATRLVSHASCLPRLRGTLDLIFLIILYRITDYKVYLQLPHTSFLWDPNVLLSALSFVSFIVMRVKKYCTHIKSASKIRFFYILILTYSDRKHGDRLSNEW